MRGFWKGGISMAIENYKEVYFDVYCEQCKHWKVPEDKHPCDICLDSPANINTHKPVEFEEKEK